ncbi:MAG: RES family NAD+ phosphorylase [Chitinophagaceae bacterium]
MIVYRIARSKYAADLSGEGARLFGGRWNHKNTACVYTAASRALAVLEYAVNVNIDDIPRGLSIARFEVPADSIISFSMADLPGDWQQHPAPSSTKDFGTAILRSAEKLLIKLPSVIIPEEWNYLINPAHADAGLIKFLDASDYPFDMRIKAR